MIITGYGNTLLDSLKQAGASMATGLEEKAEQQAVSWWIAVAGTGLVLWWLWKK